MSDYSDLIYLMGAMVVFSLLSVQTSRTFHLNSQLQINSEIEYNAVSIAQNEIDQIRWMKSETEFNSHVSKFPKQQSLAAGNDTLYFNVEVNVSDITIPGSNIDNKEVTVTVTNEYLRTNPNDNIGDRFVQLEYIKSFD